MKFENTGVWGFRHAIRGMRNPMNSWDKSDSYYCDVKMGARCAICEDNHTGRCCNGYFLGDNDLKLAQKLIKAGAEHRKFMRQIFVSVDITAPLYWWKEFDTYKVATVANSTSTMHKLATTPITLDCFEIDDCDFTLIYREEKQDSRTDVECIDDFIVDNSGDCFSLIDFLESLRKKYLDTKEKKYWKELIRWLPESWLQTRTVTFNYENLLAICSRGQRRFHKLNEWSGIDNSQLPNFISWARTLPYAQDLIFIDEIDSENKHCGNCFYFNGDDSDKEQQFCDEHEKYVSKNNNCGKWVGKE